MSEAHADISWEHLFPGYLTIDLPGGAGAKLPGKVVFVSPEIDPVNSQVNIWVEIDNEELRVRPGMRAKMTILVPPPER